MKKLLFAGAAAVMLMSGVAMAADVIIEPAHRTFIKEYVVKQRVSPVVFKERVAIGTAIPTTVAIQPVPEAIYSTVPEVRDYDYFYWDNRVVLVDRNTREVVQIIE